MKKIFVALNVSADIYLVAEIRAMLKRYNLEKEVQIDYYNFSLSFDSNINWDHNNEAFWNSRMRQRNLEVIPYALRNIKYNLDPLTDIEFKEKDRQRKREYINFFKNIDEYDIYCFTSYNRYVFTQIIGTSILRKRFPNSKVIVGGPEVVLNEPSREIFESLGCLTSFKDIDVEILEQVTGKESEWQEVRMLRKTADDIPIYEDEDLKYLDNTIRISSSRGCWSSCKFCCGPALATKDPIPRDVFANWLKQFQDRGIKEIFFNDMAINNYKFDDLLDNLLELGYNTPIPYTDVTLSRFKEDLSQFEKMAKVGFKRVAAGIECVTPEMGRLMYKQHKGRETYFEFFEELERVGIDVHLFYIFGQPGETLTSFTEDVTYFEEICQRNPKVTFEPCDFYLSPGSFIDQNREKFGVSVIPLDNPFPEELSEYTNIFNKYIWDAEYQDKHLIPKKIDHIYLRVPNIIPPE